MKTDLPDSFRLFGYRLKESFEDLNMQLNDYDRVKLFSNAKVTDIAPDMTWEEYAEKSSNR